MGAGGLAIGAIGADGGALIGCIMVAANADGPGLGVAAAAGADDVATGAEYGAGSGAGGAGGGAAGAAGTAGAPPAGGIIPMPPTMVLANAPGFAAAPPACTGPAPTGGLGTAGAAGAGGGGAAAAGSAGFCSSGETIIIVPLKRWGFAGPPLGAAGVSAVPHAEHFAASSGFCAPQLGQNIVESPPVECCVSAPAHPEDDGPRARESLDPSNARTR
jgi:hypothetical protein